MKSQQPEYHNKRINLPITGVLGEARKSGTEITGSKNG